MSLRLRSALMPTTDDATNVYQQQLETIKPTANKNELSSTNYHRLFESIAAKGNQGNEEIGEARQSTWTREIRR